MSLTQSIGVLTPDATDERPWRSRFPSPELAGAAAGLFERLPAWDGAEGRRHRIVVSPGVVAVRAVDPAKAERTAERALRARHARASQAASELLLDDALSEAYSRDAALSVLTGAGMVGQSYSAHASAASIEWWMDAVERRADRAPERTVTAWSMRSRSRMIQRLASLDYGPMFADGGVPAMVTLTYPGDWLAVAPDAATARGHIKALQLRYRRAWGTSLVGVWKREFQDRRANCWDCRRGSHQHPDSGRAPHYHLFIVPPAGEVNGQDFRAWLASAWVAIVNPARCSGSCAPAGGCCERARMLAVHLHPKVIDYGEGKRASDPRRLAVYFSKHGTFSAKDYQNQAPDEWVEQGSVGRFWGFWGLDVVEAVVEVDAAAALRVSRTLRRWSRANSHFVSVRRRRLRVHQETGEVRGERSRRTRVRVYRMKGSLGFVTVNDGPAIASALARVAALP